MFDTIDKNSYKILKIIYRCSYTSKQQLVNKLHYKSVNTLNDEIYTLQSKGFVKAQTVGQDDELNVILSEDLFNITSQGRIYVECRESQKFAELFTRTLAIIALIISIASIVVAYLKR